MAFASVLRCTLLIACVSVCLFCKATADSYSSSSSYSSSNSYASAQPGGNCFDKREVYTECGAECQEICTEPPIESCPSVCVPGCVCKSGFIRTSRDNSKCISLDKCGVRPSKPACPLYEEYNECGSPCQPSCDTRGLQIQGCGTVCVKGCFCQKGYIRISPGGICIPETNCIPIPPTPPTPPGKCNDINMEYSICGSACPPICVEHRFKILGCTAQCVEGCFCKSGYMLDRRGGKCMPEKNCPYKPIPVTCPDNEEYNHCGSPCPPSCDDDGQEDQVCPEVCMHACFCKKGFIRSTKGGACIPVEKCAPKVYY